MITKSYMMTIPPFNFLWSDPHIGHANIIKYANRPFHQESRRDSKEMDQTLLQNYNAVIGETDSVLWLGDAFFHMGRDRLREKLAKFNGRKLLILGNHDGSRTKMLDVGFAWVEREAWVSVDDIPVRFHHYPYYGIDGGHSPKNPTPQDEKVLIHGHTHDTTRVRDNMINLCVEAWNYHPVEWKTIRSLIHQTVESSHLEEI